MMSIQKLCILTVLTVAAGLLISTSRADTLAEWAIGNIDGNTDEVPTSTLAEGVNATPLTASGVSPLSQTSGELYPGTFTAAGWATSYDANKYYQFGVSTNTNNVIIQTLSLSLLRGDYHGIGAEHWRLRSSLDDYASDLMTFDISASEYNEQTAFTETFNTPLTLQSSTSITFRLYGYAESISVSSGDYCGLTNMVPGDYHGDIITGEGINLTLYGTNPEPAALSLLLIGATALLKKQRHKSIHQHGFENMALTKTFSSKK